MAVNPSAVSYWNHSACRPTLLHHLHHLRMHAKGLPEIVQVLSDIGQDDEGHLDGRIIIASGNKARGIAQSPNLAVLFSPLVQQPVAVVQFSEYRMDSGRLFGLHQGQGGVVEHLAGMERVGPCEEVLGGGNKAPGGGIIAEAVTGGKEFTGFRFFVTQGQSSHLGVIGVVSGVHFQVPKESGGQVAE